MKLYRHYKNKAYTYRGIARHSESLDELVVYETRYQNDLGRLWVRPRAMFEEDVLIEGKIQPRFAKISLLILPSVTVSEQDFKTINALAQRIFGQEFNFLINSGFAVGEKGLLLKAQIDDELVGFRWGRACGDTHFESLVQGVLPEYQGLGINKDMASFEQSWCRENNLKKILMKTLNQNKAALVTSLKDGFEVIGVEKNISQGLQIILEKTL
jgi:ribosomal protein S18 acetylase RimI-like enzyme